MGDYPWMEFHIGGIVLITFSFTYLIMMLALTCGLTRGKVSTGVSKAGRRDGLPFVSVLVAVRNEEQRLKNLLRGLLVQDYPAGCWEVVVSDDFSEDRSVALLEDFRRTYPDFPLKVVTATNPEEHAKGKKSALDRAFRTSKGSVILCTDADTTISSGWISAMSCLPDDPEAMMVLGPVFFNHGGSFLQKLQELEFFGIMGITAGSAALGIPVMANGANLCFRRDVFTMVGGYQRDSHFASGDDQFLMMSVKKQYGPGSVKFNFNLDAAIFTTAEKDLKGFFHQRIRWVSKSRGYRDGWVVLTGLVAGLTTLSLFAGVAWSVVNFSGALFIMVSGFWLVKIFSDLPMVLKMRKFSGSKVGLGYYIPAQLFQLVYAPLAGVASLFFRSRWKGRRV